MIKEKINNNVCEKCTHRDVCAFKDKMTEYQKAIDEIESVYKDEANNLFSSLIRCKQYIFKSPDIIERRREEVEFAVKDNAVKEVENIVKRSVRKKE